MKKWLPFLLFAFSLLFIPLSSLAVLSSDLTELRTETDNGYRIDYVDASGQICMATDKNYASLVRVMDGKQILEEYYFDEQNNPVTKSGYHGKQNVYENGKIVQITYVDKDHHPVKNTSGYAMVKRVVDEKNHVVQEMYFDVNGEPAVLSQGQSGMLRTAFDEQDRVLKYVYVDKDGNPMLLKDGYCYGLRTYEDGKSYVSMYFDVEGNPAKLSHGNSGIREIRNEANKHIGTTYLDANGNPMIIDLGYATVMYTYDEWNNICRYTYFDTEGQPIALSHGQYGKVIEYGKKTKLREYSIDAEGQEMFFFSQFLGENVWLNLIITVLFLFLAVLLPKKARALLAILYVGFILYMTLMGRETVTESYNLELFWSYRQIFESPFMRREVLNNILLFVPLGALLCSFTGNPAVLLCCVCLSLMIELSQGLLGIGLCELDDLFGNSLGSLLGWIGCVLVLRICKKQNRKENPEKGNAGKGE